MNVLASHDHTHAGVTPKNIKYKIYRTLPWWLNTTVACTRVADYQPQKALPRRALIFLALHHATTGGLSGRRSYRNYSWGHLSHIRQPSRGLSGNASPPCVLSRIRYHQGILLALYQATTRGLSSIRSYRCYSWGNLSHIRQPSRGFSGNAPSHVSSLSGSVPSMYQSGRLPSKKYRALPWGLIATVTCTRVADYHPKNTVHYRGS